MKPGDADLMVLVILKSQLYPSFFVVEMLHVHSIDSSVIRQIHVSSAYVLSHIYQSAHQSGLTQFKLSDSKQHHIFTINHHGRYSFQMYLQTYLLSETEHLSQPNYVASVPSVRLFLSSSSSVQRSFHES